MRFTLRQVEIFVEAAKDGNFRKTADRLGISQPSISKHIKLLERNAGGQLFERSRGSSARLSDLGETLLQEARTMLTAARTVRAVPGPVEGCKFRLKVVAGNYLYDRFLRPAIRHLYTIPDMPDVSILAVEDSDKALAVLRRGEADIAFYTGEPVKDPNLVAEALGQARVGIYGAPALARSVKDWPIARLNDAPFIVAPEETAAGRWQVAALSRLGIQPGKVVSRSQFMEVTVDQVVNGTGLALLFDRDVQDLVEAGKIVRLPIEVTGGYRCMVIRRQIHDDPRSGPTIDYLREIIR